MGEVYLADDTKLKTQVALKRLAPSLQRDPSYRKLLEREAQKAAQLRDSPHVATLHEIFDTEQGETFLVMEYVEGNSLRYWVREPVSLDAFMDVAIQCLQGVEEAHRKRIIHRDIKPENIIVRSDGQVKICDFGVAKRLRVEETDQGSAVNTQPYQSEGRTFADGIAGTPAYMAPEAWELPADDIDERADVFSLGAVFYEILAKQNPFRGSTLQETRDRVEHLVPYPLRDYNPRVPPRLDRIITRMLSKERNDRYATAEEIRKEVVAIGASLQSRLPHVIGSVVALLTLVAVLWGVVGTEPTTQSGDTLVVLPFSYAPDDVDARAFALGLSSRVNDRLRIYFAGSTLDVIAGESVRRRRIGNWRQAAENFGADIVLAGSLSGAPGARVVAYELLGSTGELLRAGEIEAQNLDPAILSERILNEILDIAEVQVSQRSATGLSSQSSEAATELYTRGIGFMLAEDSGPGSERAITLFRQAVALDPGYAAAHAALGDLYLEQYHSTQDAQWIEQARAECSKSLQYLPTLAQGHACLGDAAYLEGEYSMGLGEFQLAATLNRTSGRAQRGIARSHARLGNAETAESMFRLRIDAGSLETVDFRWLGGFYADRGRFEEAEAEFKLAIELDPDDGFGHRALGGVRIQLGNYGDAITALSRALELRPRDGLVRSNLGMAYFRLGAYDGAVTVFEQAVSLSAEHTPRGNLARALYWAGRTVEAEENYRLAVRLGQERLSVNPDDAATNILIARYYSMMNQEDAALEHLRVALNRAVDDPEYFLIASSVHSRLGHIDKALDYLEEAVASGHPIFEIRATPELEGLRSSPRFQTILARSLEKGG